MSLMITDLKKNREELFFPSAIMTLAKKKYFHKALAGFMPIFSSVYSCFH